MYSVTQNTLALCYGGDYCICKNEAGEYWLALEQGEIQPSHIKAELGELILNTRPGRTSNEEQTIFRSLGLAIEDICAAQFLLERAYATGSGTTVQF